jgi:hypothetical protein
MRPKQNKLAFRPPKTAHFQPKQLDLVAMAVFLLATWGTKQWVAQGGLLK